MDHLEEVFKHLLRHGVRVNRTECRFLKSSVNFLGHRIDAKGIHPLQEKLTAILQAPAPKSVQELRSFLRLINYYGKFIPNAAHLHSTSCCVRMLSVSGLRNISRVLKKQTSFYRLPSALQSKFIDSPQLMALELSCLTRWNRASSGFRLTHTFKQLCASREKSSLAYLRCETLSRLSLSGV